MVYSQKTKIVATIGPNTANPSMLKKMYSAGMSLARLNGSHNTLDWHESTIKLIKKTLPDCPILLDIPGKKIRTSKLIYEPKFQQGDIVILTTVKGHNGKKKVSITNNKLHLHLSKGDIVFADDGTLKFIVIKVVGKDIYLRALSSGILKSSKGINIPHVNISGKLITARDKKMIDFAIKNHVDFIGISFVESGKHVKMIKNLIKQNLPKIVAKIENQKGINRLDEIINCTDVIMIDRGDLSTETNIETLGINQKQIIRKSIELAKPVIVATEMLDNMITSPNPTKAEVLDISNSVLDGATATMLSGETAVGKYPVESIRVMSKISSVTIKNKYENEKKYKENSMQSETLGMSNAIDNLCYSLPVNKIVAITITGFAARVLSSLIMEQPIIAVSNNKDLARGFNILAGTTGVYVKTRFFKDSLEHIPICLHNLWKKRYILEKDFILVTALGYPSSGRRMNLLQTHLVKDLISTFSWK